MSSNSETIIKADLSRNAERGARFLDAHAPGWWLRADPQRLSMSDAWRCVLGQLYTTYGQALDTLNLVSSEAVSFGFELPHFMGESARTKLYGWLTDCWRRQILIRQHPKTT